MQWIGKINETRARKDSQVAFQAIPDQDFIPTRFYFNVHFYHSPKPDPSNILSTTSRSLNNISLKSFCYSANTMLGEFHSCLYQLAYSKLVSLYIVSLKVAEPIDNIK